MLSNEPAPPEGDGGAAAVAARVLDVVGETSGLSRAELLAGRAADGSLDSLTSIAIVTRLEAAFGIALGDEALALLAAGELGALARLVARAVAPQHANLGETTGNESC